jgi:predicted Zn-dependent protease
VGTPEETAALATRNLAEAAEVLEPLASRDPRAAELLGEVRMQQGDPTAARRCFEMAAERPVCAVALSRLAAAGGDYRKALGHSAAALRLLPGSPAAIRLHAANLIRTKQQDEAQRLLVKLVELDPVDAVAVHLLAQAARERADRARWTAAARALLHQTDPPSKLDVELEWLGWTGE